MAYIKRAAENTIARLSEMFPVLLVTGPSRWEKRPFCKSSQKRREAREWHGNM